MKKHELIGVSKDPITVLLAEDHGAYLIKQSSTHVLAQAVREVFEGNSFFCAPISKALRVECQKLFGKGELLKKRAAQAAILAADGC